ncbi:MAG: hypothetical protein AABW63_01980 [Nanoarchaeota archaeon]
MTQKFYINSVFDYPVSPMIGMVLLKGCRLNGEQADEKSRLGRELAELGTNLDHVQTPELLDLRKKYHAIVGWPDSIIVDGRGYKYNQVLDKIPQEAIDADFLFKDHTSRRPLDLI